MRLRRLGDDAGDAVEDPVSPEALDLESLHAASADALNTVPAAACNTHRVGGGVLHQGDCMEVMRDLPDGCAKVVITSPPYNLSNSSGGFWNSDKDTSSRWKQAALRSEKGYEGHDDCMPRSEYEEWQRACLGEMMRLISDDGAVFYNHKWRTQNGILETPDPIVAGFPTRQIIIWARPGGVNFTERFYVPTYEVIYLLSKPDFDLVPMGNRHGTVWSFPPAKGNPHPAPFPLTLPSKVLSSIAPGLVLDPFMGSGTTAVAAERLGWPWIGIEQSQKYCEQACKRIDDEARQGKLPF